MRQKAYINLAYEPLGGAAIEWQIHYYSKGQGPDVVLLHPSPLSGDFMSPIMDLLADDCRVIAWDTPGYGQSDSLPYSNEDLSGYVEALHQFIVALDLKNPLIYGSATGAQVGIEYAKTYPQGLCGLLLENAAWFTDEERTQLLTEYFPTITARDDGSHLSAVWQMVSQLYHYFPWFDTSDSARVNSAHIPAEIKQKTLMAYFTAGDKYDLAYRAAFMNEKPEKLRQVCVPTHILRWESGLLKKYVDRLDDANLPSNIVMQFAGAGIENRFRQLKASVVELLSNAE